MTCETCGQPVYVAEATGETCCSNPKCALSVRSTYQCDRCKTTYSRNGSAPTSYCVWGGCNGTAHLVRTFTAPKSAVNVIQGGDIISGDLNEPEPNCSCDQRGRNISCPRCRP